MELPFASTALANTFIVVVAIGVAVEVAELFFLPQAESAAPAKTISANATTARLAPDPNAGCPPRKFPQSASAPMASAASARIAGRAGNCGARSGLAVTMRKIPFGPRAPGAKAVAGVSHGFGTGGVSTVAVEVAIKMLKGTVPPTTGVIGHGMYAHVVNSGKSFGHASVTISPFWPNTPSAVSCAMKVAVSPCETVTSCD